MYFNAIHEKLIFAKILEYTIASVSLKGEALEAAEVLIDRIEGVALDIAGSIVEKRKRLRCRVKSCTSNCYCRLIGCTTCKAKTIGWWWTKKKVHRCDV